MILQSGDALRFLNEFRNRMKELDIHISETEIKNFYNLYIKSDLSVDEFRKKLFDRLKKYKEKYKMAQDVEKNPDNKDLLDIDFPKKGITLNYQDIDILGIIDCSSFEELIEYAKSLDVIFADEEYIRSYIELDDAKKYVYDYYVDALVNRYDSIIDTNLNTRTKLNLLIEKEILTEDEVKSLTDIISSNNSVDDIVSSTVSTFGEDKAEEIFKVFNARVVAKAGIKESSWNEYLCMYEKIKEFDTYTLDDIMKYNSIVMINDEPNYTNFKKALDFAKKHDKKVRLNTLVFYMDFPNRYKGKSKDVIKEYLRKYVVDLCRFIKENGYEDIIESIDALNELINRSASNKGLPFGMREEFNDNSDNLNAGWLKYLTLEDVLDILRLAKKELPNTKFIYNEVYLFDERKYDVFVKVLDRIKEYEDKYGIKIIDGIGEQLHIDVNTDISKIDKLLAKLRENGLTIDITEFDMFVGGQEKYLVPIQLEEVRQYRMNELYEVLSKYPDVINSFTIWSKTDDMDHNLYRVNEQKLKFKDKLVANIHGGYFDLEFNTKRDALVSNLKVINGPSMQPFNFHTHTNRCGKGSRSKDEDYVIEAISKGMKSFGFTEHAPSTKIEYDEINEKMSSNDFNEYVQSIRKLNNTYEEIDIYLGLESDFSQALKSHLINLRKQVDYMILGQHKVVIEGEEIDPNNNPEYPIQYARCVVEALDSGIYDIVGHPDYFMIYRDKMSTPENYAKFMENAVIAADMIGRKCEELKIPLEINLDSITRVESDVFKDGEHAFTHPVFYNELTKYDVRFMYGCDAHKPKGIKDINENILRAETILKTSEMLFVPEDYNPVKYRNPELDTKLLLSEANAYSYETGFVLSILEKITKGAANADLDLKIIDSIEGLISQMQKDNKMLSQQKFEELIKVAEDQFVSDEDKDFMLKNNLAYMDSFGAVSTARLNLLYKLKNLVVEASNMGCYRREDYLIVVKELMEKYINKDPDIQQRSDDNIVNYVNIQIKRRH